MEHQWSVWMWVGAWVGANTAYMVVKLFVATFYAATVNFRVLRALPRLEELGYTEEEVARVRDLLEVDSWGVAHMLMWPAPYIVLPGWEVAFRKELRSYTAKRRPVPPGRRSRERRRHHHRVIVRHIHRFGGWSNGNKTVH